MYIIKTEFYTLLLYTGRGRILDLTDDSVSSDFAGFPFDIMEYYSNSIYKRLDAHSFTNDTLAQCNPNALQSVMTVAENVDANADSYTWSVPANSTLGVDYALELGVSPNISYTCLLTIQAGNGSSNTSPSASASSPSVAKRDVAAFAPTSNKAALGAFAVAGATAIVLVPVFSV
ncbi:hypothetical protein G6F37_011421 [Rhizopus arrhizus]|nr:hypothetical protein G6F38_011505 [Rhizopus arrhizus]KAG1149413.1 hypothetical protein G6F37_011421 [Rhizopus arrhizus]